jgi:hypothetical protein
VHDRLVEMLPALMLMLVNGYIFLASRPAA